MTEYLAHLAGGIVPAMLVALAFGIAFAGTGYGFLRVCGLGRGLMRGLTLLLVSLAAGVCREQARGVLSQNMMVTFWGTVDLSNLIHFLELRDSDHAQWEIREYAKAIKKLIKPVVPHVAEYYESKGEVW